MAIIPTRHPNDGVQIGSAAELATAPTVVLDIGTAPDGLPWILSVDRAARLRSLYNSVVSAFEVGSRDELPERVKNALAADVASGLMGVHTAPIAGSEREVYVSRRPLKRLVGRTMLERLLVASDDTPVAPTPERMCITSVNPISTGDYDALDAFDEALLEAETSRHLLVGLSDGSTHVGSVAPDDRALRTPSGAVRRMVRESLAGFDGTVARFDMGDKRWEVALKRTGNYVDALSRVAEGYLGGSVSYAVPRQSILEVLVRLAKELGALHTRQLVHGDLSPANVLVEDGRPVAFDALGVETGQVAFAATFDWAAPEQVLARPLDPRADVYAIGKMLCALVGGVPFGEKTTYTVPAGGLDARDVAMLKTDGVYVDIQETNHDRVWQAAWQDVLARTLSFDRDRRPFDGPSLAGELSKLAKRQPLEGEIVIPGNFGALVHMKRPATWSFARVIDD